MINFAIGGRLGDFFHCLFAVKNICEQHGDKANIFLVNGGDVFVCGVEQAYKDLGPVVLAQSYVNKFELFKGDYWDRPEALINMTSWRGGPYGLCYSEMLAKNYNFKIPDDPNKISWLVAQKPNEQMFGKTLIHRCCFHGHNDNVPWEEYIDRAGEIYFLDCCDGVEWDAFQFKNKVKRYVTPTFEDMVNTIAGCKYYIGNQSGPLAVAFALGKPRMAFLDTGPALLWYRDEVKYSKTLSYYQDEQNNHIAS